VILGWLVRGRRVYVGRRRIHHGRFGWWLAIAGVLLMLDDLLDWPWPFEH
jgi:hypothetical protein